LLLQSTEVQKHLTLTQVGAVVGVSRQDHLLEDNITTPRVNAAAFDESKETEVLKESTGALCIGSVLIATVTFGVTFAVPGGYIADDRNNGGSPILARRHAFDAFIWSNTLAFILSTIATIALMRSGNPLFNLWSRKTNLHIASSSVSLSITCLAAAFALAAYVVLAPMARNTAQGIPVLTCLVLLYNQLEFIHTRLILLKPLHKRKGLIRACILSALTIMGAMVSQYWPLIFIFGLAKSASQSPKIEAPAPAQLAST
jgi:cytochrome bd-type quinol oxidase subunit 2